MNTLIENIKKNTGLVWVIKAIASISIALFILRLAWGEGLETYYSYKEIAQEYYRYITLSSVLEFVVKILVAVFMAAMMCYTVINFEKICPPFLKENKKQGFSYALYFAVSIAFLYNPLSSDNTEVLVFKRVIGHGIKENIDVTRRINNFAYWFLLFTVAFLLFYMLSNYLLNKTRDEEANKMVAFLDSFVVLANCNLFLRCITYFQDVQDSDNYFYFSQYSILLILIFSITYLLLGLDKYVTVDIFECITVIIFNAAISLAVFYGKELENGKLVLGYIALLYIIAIVLCRYVGKHLRIDTYETQIRLSAIIISVIPLATSLYIELIHILNQHNIFVTHPAKYYKIACIIGFCCYIIFFYVSKKNRNSFCGWQKISFPLMVAGVSCLGIQIPLSQTYYMHLFESANSSILISDFLNFGDIPIVQHYGGHMMTEVWGGILYAVVNNDYSGIASPYKTLITPLLILLFYYMISRVWNREMGLTMVLLFPFLDFVSYYCLGIMVCLAAMSFVKKNSYLQAFVLWGAVIWCVLYRLDLGFSFAIAVILSLFMYVFVSKNIHALKQLTISLIACAIICGVGWTVICISNEINPAYRLLEFIMISSSNNNFGFNNSGDVNEFVFAWGYIIIPFVMIIALVYIICSSQFRKAIGQEKWMLLIILNLSYFGNYARGLTRHSLAELAFHVVFWSSYLFLALFICFYKKNMKMFAPIFMVFLLLNALLGSNENFKSLPIVESAFSSVEPIIESWKPTRFYDKEESIVSEDGTSFRTVWERYKYEQDRVDRVILDDDIKEYIAEYEYVLNTLLGEGETFVDFINKTTIYSALGYECPVYVSQSPLQLSGEFTQGEFIREIEGVPILLMPIDEENYEDSTKLDGINNSYRYYKVYEYLCQNYRPLCRYGDDFAVWCLPSRYDEYMDKIKYMQAPVEPIDYGYDGPFEFVDSSGCVLYEYIGTLHTTNAYYLPKIWAESDIKDAVNNKVICDLFEKDGLYLLNSSGIYKDLGNYLKISAIYGGADTQGKYEEDDEISDATVIFGMYDNGNFIEKYGYDFNIFEGEHEYLIRCSTDYYWYHGEINAVLVRTDAELRNVSMQILEGD